MTHVKWLTHDGFGNELPPRTGRTPWFRPVPPVPRPSRREYLVDLCLGLLLAMPAKPVARYTQTLPQFADRELGKGIAIAIGLVLLGTLTIRRRFPLLAFWLALAGAVALHVPLLNIAAAAMICGYSAGVYSPYRRLALASLPVALLELWAIGYFDLVPGDNNLVVFPVGIPLAAAAAFYGAEVRRQARTDLAGQRRAREERQQTEIREAVEGERARIARELHDVVTHNVSVMVVMAGAARKVLESSPEQATEALLAVESAGRAAMAELRQVMGLLTEDVRDRHKLTPEPGLDQIRTLISRIRAAGVPITYRLIGEPVALPPGLDLTAYRVVQEALTNAVKHASGASIDVEVEYRPAELQLTISDTGGVPGETAASGNGRGLLGLKERAALHGGSVQAAPRPFGGYRVRAKIPLPVEDTV